ncbi:MAG: hypothetical protein COB67_11520 [SAR324 cluster bacterium]|uniref:3-keto-alpha-glucoside-1,2-lyase/3-keto-2-hydroxy-glucal hydratase domain-containing protein n=1 Tax=SAR324 cluster bacterium TaxID=2024889 RepID=A0A2A4STC2_9DELT|nr:MAG: hypothetical protein COB67_11520 [SAR324 cluster bacterium]
MKKVIILLSLLGFSITGFLLFYNGFDVVDVTLSEVKAGQVIDKSMYVHETVENEKTILRYPLDSTYGLTPNHVVMGLGSKLGKEGVFVKIGADSTPEGEETFVLVEESEFQNGIIEVEVNGSVSSKASLLTRFFARGFIGIGFRINEDQSSFESFYLRPANGPAEDEERRNHAVQYFSYPEWSWSRLRDEYPEKYEAAAPVMPGEWQKMRIEVQGNTAKLFINDAGDPVLVVNDLKLGAKRGGKVGLWVGRGTNGFFRNLKITKL